MNRKNFIKILSLGGLAVMVGVKTIGASTKKLYINNPILKTIKENFLGTPTIDSKFMNLGFNFKHNPLNILKWQFSKNPQKEEKENENYSIAITKCDNVFESKDDMIVWLGHATLLIRLGGKTFLTDPIFGGIPFKKRNTELPFSLSSLTNIDFILISHSHRDHLDKESLKNIKCKTRALVPLNMTKLMNSANDNISVTEAGWYQKYNNTGNVEVVFLPSKHWSKRGAFDYNDTLWGSFLLKYNGKSIYFAGDSGYSEHFKEIQKTFGDIDYCIMPIGAYKPDYIMKHSHMTPQESVMAFNDLGGKTFIPMHYGTFDLSDEPLGEPIKFLKDIENNGEIDGKLEVLNIGESLMI